MKIYKDILKALSIDTVYILNKKTLYMCMPVEINKDRWSVLCDSDSIEGNSALKVKYHGSFIYLESMIIRRPQKDIYSFAYEVLINSDEFSKDSFKKTFFHELGEMEKKSDAWNKRKEERYEIGFDEERQKLIRFKSPEQLLVADKIQLPCFINNLSYSGAKVTTLEGNFHKDKKVCLNLSFTSPIEQIPLIGTVKNCIIKSTFDKKIISVLSLFFENSPVGYKQRLDTFISQLNGE